MQSILFKRFILSFYSFTLFRNEPSAGPGSYRDASANGRLGDRVGRGRTERE